MEQYDNTNKGVLFNNERKEQERQPDYTGSININGTDYNLAGWVRQSKAGKRFLSLSVSDRQEKSDTSSNGDATLGNDFPF